MRRNPVFQYKNRVCPVCHKPVGGYSYTFNEHGAKIHIYCSGSEKQ